MSQNTPQSHPRFRTVIDGVEVVLSGITPNSDEALAYLDRGRRLYGRNLVAVEASIPQDEPSFVDITYRFRARPFQRLRRITGYLVGTLDRFNNGKRAEERDRVKHSL